ncbi:hypothetical protein CCL16_14350, partial [Pseudomonas syringae]
RVVMPFRTLRVLLRRRASRTAFPRWSVRNDNLNYRATLRVLLGGIKVMTTLFSDRVARTLQP